MFYNCGSLEYVPPLTISNKCTNLNSMFYYSGIKNINTTNWNTSNVTNINNLFHGCLSINEFIGIENLDVSNVKNMSNVFNGCISL